MRPQCLRAMTSVTLPNTEDLTNQPKKKLMILIMNSSYPKDLNIEIILKIRLWAVARHEVIKLISNREPQEIRDRIYLKTTTNFQDLKELTFSSTRKVGHLESILIDSQ